MSQLLTLFFHLFRADVPTNTYVAEDGVTDYVAANGLTYYVKES